MKANIKIAVLGITLMLSGCASEPELGYHVTKLKSEQTYNPDATLQNRDVIPAGTGERMEGAYSVYTGKNKDSLQSTGQSQVLIGF